RRECNTGRLIRETAGEVCRQPFQEPDVTLRVDGYIATHGIDFLGPNGQSLGQNRQISGAELRLDQNTLGLFRQQHLAQLCNMARPWLSFRVEGEGAGLVESVV